MVIVIWDAESKTSVLVEWTVDSWSNVGSFLAKTWVTFTLKSVQVVSMFCPSVLLFYVWRSICMLAILRHWKSLRISGQRSDFWGVWSSPIHFSREIHRCYWLTVFCLGLTQVLAKCPRLRNKWWHLTHHPKFILEISTIRPKAKQKTSENFKIWMWPNRLGPTPSCPSPSPVGCTPVAPLRRYLAWKNAVSNLSFSVRVLSFWMFFSISVVCTSQRLVTWIAWWRWYAMDLCDEEHWWWEGATWDQEAKLIIQHSSLHIVKL